MFLIQMIGCCRLSSLPGIPFTRCLALKNCRSISGDLGVKLKVFEHKAEKTGSAEMSQNQVKQFYRRELPQQCIAFSSSEGKKLFSESLSQGYMECYFKLAEQFRTQDEPAFCGLTTLVMVLNSLSVDPGRVWKGPWRWYHENMLDCCVPLQMIKEEGVNFQQMICLACCNGLDVQAHQMTDSDNTEEAVDNFRTLVHNMTQKEDGVLVLSYTRKVLGQTGDGHFSPVGGYHPARDLVLILDTARFKYPPHWVPLTLIWEAMNAKDKSTGKPRGYMVMSRMDVPNTLVLFRIFPVFSVSLSRHLSGGVSTFTFLWRQWLSQDASQEMTEQEVKLSQETTEQDVTSLGIKSCTKASPSSGNDTTVNAQACCKEKISDIDKTRSFESSLNHAKLPTHTMTEVENCIIYLLQIADNISAGDTILTTNVDLKCVQDESREHACLLQVLLTELESLPLFKAISKILDTLYSESPDARQTLNKLGYISEGMSCKTAKICKANSQVEECNLAKRLNHSHFLTIFLLSWPYGKGDKSVLTNLARDIVDSHEESVLRSECRTLRKQISLLMKLCQETIIRPTCC